MRSAVWRLVVYPLAKLSKTLEQSKYNRSKHYKSNQSSTRTHSISSCHIYKDSHDNS